MLKQRGIFFFSWDWFFSLDFYKMAELFEIYASIVDIDETKSASYFYNKYLKLFENSQSEYAFSRMSFFSFDLNRYIESLANMWWPIKEESQSKYADITEHNHGTFFFFKAVSSKQPRKNKINLLGSGGFQFSTTPIACYHEGYVNFMKLKDRRNQQWKSIGSLLFHTYFVLCEKMILEARVE